MTGLKKGIMCTLFALFAFSALCSAEGTTRRFGIFIGSNNGGRDRGMLRYAVSDARSVSKVFTEMGGIALEDSVLLVEPNVRDINARMDAVQRQLAAAKQDNQRTELVFYYSGHSDEDGLLLNRERYSYKDLRGRIDLLPSDMRIVILDSCSSGAFTRAKGGIKTKPFLMDSSLSAEGYAFLTSSSADEASQESDSIESSYFTHSLLAGLRGAADTIGDGRVTLNEAYRFAYAETLSKTETSVFGAQHPSYDMQVSGTGDVVLTDIKEISASLMIDSSLAGRLSIRDSSDFLIAELTKNAGKPIELGLESGLYRITLQQGESLFRAEVPVAEGSRTPLSQADFVSIGAVSARARGDAEPEVSAKPEPPVVPVSIQFVGASVSSNTILIGVLGANGHHLRGVGAASLWLINSGTVEGVQAAGLFNIAAGGVKGVQAAGLLNITGSGREGVQAAGLFNVAGGSVKGVQAAGLFNIAAGGVKGVQAAGIFNSAGGGNEGWSVQAGLVNISQNEQTVSFGLVNVIKNGILHPAIYYDDAGFYNISLRSGSKYVYSVLSAGSPALKLGSFTLGSEDRQSILIARAGMGVELPLGRFYLDFDVTSGILMDFKTQEDLDRNIKNTQDLADLEKHLDAWKGSTSQVYQARLAAGYNFFTHLGIFAGVSWDYVHRYSGTSPTLGSGFLDAYRLDDRNSHKFAFFAGVQF